MQQRYGVTEIYHPPTTINTTGYWTTTNYPLNTARAFQTATLLGNGKVLEVGGCHLSYCLTSLASKEIYNSANNPWTNGPSSSVQRYGHSATLLANGKVLVAGGTTSYATYAQADLYDPAVKPNGAFTATGSLHKGRCAHTDLPHNKSRT